MRLSIKVLLWLWLLLFLIIGGVVYSTYSKLHPEAFISLLTKQVQKTYPGAEVEVGEVDYNLSINFNLNLKNVILKRSNQVMGRLGEIELKIPWWLLIVNRGNAQINVSDLEIFLENTNLNKSPQIGEASDAKAGASSQSITIELPEYLNDLQYTIRAKNIAIKEIDGSRTLLKLSKLLVREFQYGKNSAFELKLPISIGHKGMNYSSELWLFGDITPERDIWNLYFRGGFRTQGVGEKVHFDDVIVEGKTRFKPREVDVYSELEFSIEKDEIGDGVFVATDKKFSLDLNFTRLPVEFLRIFETELRNTRLTELNGMAKGAIHLSRLMSEPKVTLKGELQFPGPFKIAEKSEVQGDWKLSFENARWDSSFISPKGEVSFFRRSVIDAESGKVRQYSEELGFTGLELPTTISAIPSLSDLMNAPAKEYFSSIISYKKCLLNGEEMDGVFKVGISPELKFYQGKFSGSNDKAMKVSYGKSAEEKIDLSFVNFAWIPEFQFLAPFFHARAGVLNGKIEGRWESEWLSGKWLIKLKAQGLEAPSGEIVNLNQTLWTPFRSEPIIITDINASAQIRNGAMKIDSIMLEGPDPAKLSGLIDSDAGKKSYLILNYPKNRKWKPVRKEFEGIFWQKEEG